MREMKRNKQTILGMALVVFGAMLFLGCGPTYPECSTDEHCQEQGQYCVNKMCRDCADDSDCAGQNPCKVCGDGYSCVQNPGCCTSDLDCPGGRCWAVAGTNFGECGARCRVEGATEDCPSGQICKGGNCVPNVECTDASQCPPGKACVSGACVLAACTVDTIHFDFGESRLLSEARAALEKGAECVKERNQNVTIEGHCDDRGTDEYNMALGERRARRAMKYMQSLGVSVNLNTLSYGEERPVCTQAAENCWWRNRRAEFIFP